MTSCGVSSERPTRRASLIVIIGAFLSSAVGCTTHCAGMAPTTSPSGGPPRELLTFARNSPLVGSGYKLVLFDDGCLEYQGSGRVETRVMPDMFVERPAIARVRANLERLSALRPELQLQRGGRRFLESVRPVLDLHDLSGAWRSRREKDRPL